MPSQTQKRYNADSSDRLLALLVQLFRYVSKRRKYQFTVLLGLTLISAIAEIINLGAVVPFIGILTQPLKVFNYPLIREITKVVEVSSPDQLILPLAALFILAALISGGLRLLLCWAGIRLSNAAGADLSIEIYRRTLYQPYCVHVARNSSEVISGITQQAGTAISVLLSIINTTTAVILFMAILAVLFVIDPVATTIAIIGFGACYALITIKVRHQLVRNSHYIVQEQTQVVKALQEGLGAIRDVLLDGTQVVYCNIYRGAVQKLQRAFGENVFIGQSPRYVMESFGIVLLIGLAMFLNSQSHGVGETLPVLGALALGAQRMIPLLQQIYSGWSIVAGSRAALIHVLALLAQPLPKEALLPTALPLAFHKAIHFDNVWFRYRDHGPWVLSGLDLTIKKGQRVGFIGTTGSGKSTALDLLMALLEPTQGKVLVDDQILTAGSRQAWQRTLAHVPQSIFLADITIAENIALGTPLDQIDLERVQYAARRAQIAEFIESCAEGYNTLVGERGIRLSGGQRQRIGIARALYKQATVLVFDEATSSLDTTTEKAVISAIEGLDTDLTMMIVAHRLTTLQYCDTIIQLEHGKIVAKGSYDYFMSVHPDYQKVAGLGS